MPQSSDPTIIAILKDRLRSSPYWSPKTKDTGKYINELICPSCGKPEAFTYSDRPFALFCHRLNQCGEKTKLSTLFPDIYANIEHDHPPTDADPDLPARAYLNMRGLSKSLEGMNFEYWADIRKTGCGGVMFPVYGNKGQTSYNGRIFNPPADEGKTHNQGLTTGLIWKHPNFEYNTERETFVTEGIIDALSLMEIDRQAVAILAAGQNPKRIILTGFKKLVFAFDNDAAGARALRRWKDVYPDAGAIMPPAGIDWNDWICGNLRDKFDDRRTELEWYAKLALAPTAKKYAETWFEFKSHVPGLFEFDGRYFWSEYKDTKNGPDIKTVKVSEFTLTVDHYQLDVSNLDEPVNRYYLKVKPQKGKPISCSVTADDLCTPTKMRAVLLNRARVLWSGQHNPTMALLEKITKTSAPVVRQLYITGYDQITGHYFMQHFMVDKTGRTHWLNKSGFFKAASTNYVRPAQIITIRPTTGTPCKAIYELMYQAWGENGLTAIAWMVAGWFVRQIKSKIGFFPFLSLHHHTQTGKSMLTRYLNAMQGFDEEGLPMRKTNTSKGEIRKLAQRSGLFVALLEWPIDGKARFDLDTTLTMYNEAPLQVRAIKSNDLQTQELPFLGTLMFVQNREPFITRAQKERVVSLDFNRENITPKTTEAIANLARVPLSDFASMFTFIMSHRSEIESRWYQVYEKARAILNDDCLDSRVRDNHAIILAFDTFLRKVFERKADLIPFFKKISFAKASMCDSNETPLATEFLDAVCNMDEDKNGFDRVCVLKGNRLCVRPTQCLDFLIEHRQFPTVPLESLLKQLRKHPAFIESGKSVKFGYDGYKAWVFDSKEL